MALKLPVGYKFCPSDKELLEDYLKRKIQGTLSWDVIQEKEIYGPNANPWEIFSDSSTQWITFGKQKSVYVFTRLTKMADKESSGEGSEGHYVRTAGCGTWHVETGRKAVMDGDNNPIGEKRMLVFQISDTNGLKNGVQYYWNMHEYLLKGIEDYVVCRITLDMMKTVKVCPKDVSGRRGSTKSKAKKKSATTSNSNQREKAVLVNSFCDPRKEVASNIDDSSTCGFSYENQRCIEERIEMVYQNLLASTNTLCLDGSDQRSIPNEGMPQYDDARGRSCVEKPEGQGLNILNDDQGLNNEEAAQPVIMGEGFQNMGTVLSDFNGGSEDEVYLDLEDINIIGDDFWSDAADNVPMMDQPLPNHDVPLNSENLLDAGSWSDLLEELGQDDNNVDNVPMMDQPLPNSDLSLNFVDLLDAGSWSDLLEKLGQVNNNVQEQPQQQWQQPTQNMSCGLGKRKSFEAEEAGPAKKTCM
ncbi:NAC domain-containing protein 7-like [Daucus carota subsp. sativus]|uniref:NAC domain-containing protein 7-like n=1 Tax=Daucus carota subsp. sativus TaxID=79200 RepID=UPI0007EFA091|nr:PREDICTED: NAC domain-containing protein 7-like [Daucus carota subsp. sativus]